VPVAGYDSINQNQLPLSSFRTIQRKNIFRRLQAELRDGVAICFRVRRGASGWSKTGVPKWMSESSTFVNLPSLRKVILQTFMLLIIPVKEVNKIKQIRIVKGTVSEPKKLFQTHFTMLHHKPERFIA